MKKTKLPPQMYRLMLAAPALVAFSTGLMAQSQGDNVELKMQLMSAGLTARDNGDLATAKKDFTQLLALAPDDATVQRLLVGVNASLAAQPVAPVVATDNAAPVLVTFPGATGSSGAANASADATTDKASSLAKQEDARLKGLIKAAYAKRSDARKLARDTRFDDAAAVLDGAIATLPANNATKDVLADLQADRNALMLEKAQYLLGQGDTVGARNALDAYSQSSTANSRKVEKVSSQINSTELNPPLPSVEKVDPQFINAQKDVAKLVARGRSQYLAADLDGAMESFHQAESIAPNNPEVKSFIARIARAKAQISALNHVQTRNEMIDEVGGEWQRPGVYLDHPIDTTAQTGASTPLDKKLQDIIIPSVNFNGVELTNVVSTLSAISADYDKSDTAAKGVNIVLLDPSNKNPSVSITLRNLSLKRILDFITEATGYQYDVQDDAIVVRPGGDTSTLDTVVFPITRSTLIRMTGAGSSSSTASSSSGAAAATDPFAPAPAAGGGGSTGGAGGGGEASALRGFLQQAGVDFDGTPKSSLAFDGSAIIVTQSQRNIQRIRNILNRYNDVRQVEIEAKFMDVQQGVLNQLGVDWYAANTSSNISQTYGTAGSAGVLSAAAVTGATSGYSVLGTLAQAFTSSSSSSGNGSIATAGSVVVNTAGNVIGTLPGTTTPIPNPAPTLPGQADLGASAAPIAVLGGKWGNFSITAALRALAEQTGTDLLSAPKVTVLSGNPADIRVGQEMRYPQSYGQIQSQVGTAAATTGGTGGGSAGVTITAGTPQDFTMRNVGVELKVTPTVEDDDYSITLDLDPIVTEFDGFIQYGGTSVAISSGTTVTVPSGFYQPIFSTREITTKVTVWDGATIVMGGLTREQVQTVNNKVPVLGDIPLLGRLFQSNGKSSQKRNLLVFVTANLVSPGGSPKKQMLRNIPPASMFQNSSVVTPGGAVPRAFNGSSVGGTGGSTGK